MFNSLFPVFVLARNRRRLGPAPFGAGPPASAELPMVREPVFSMRTTWPSDLSALRRCVDQCARGLMQRTYMREHFCVTCGQILYYSREDGG
jgi:hypothetical protein